MKGQPHVTTWLDSEYAFLLTKSVGNMVFPLPVAQHAMYPKSAIWLQFVGVLESLQDFMLFF